LTVPNALTIDVESWTHKHFIAGDSTRLKRLDNGYVRRATADTLDIFRKTNLKTTFYVVGEIFEWYPELIDSIREDGHEIGFQSHTHSLIHNRRDLEAQLKLGRRVIDEIGPAGFRSPQVMMKREYLPILKDHGFTYDSSVYAPFNVEEVLDGLVEAPVSTYPYGAGASIRNVRYPTELDMRLLAREFPFGSGLFVGLLQKRIGGFIRRVNRSGIPASLILHSWQIHSPSSDPGNPQDGFLRRAALVPYRLNCRGTLIHLLKNHSFTTMINLINKTRNGNAVP